MAKREPKSLFRRLTRMFRGNPFTQVWSDEDGWQEKRKNESLVREAKDTNREYVSADGRRIPSTAQMVEEPVKKEKKR